MEITKNDIIMFYTLYNHYNPISNNIGIVGDNNYFESYMETIIKFFKKNKYKIIINPAKTKYTFILDDIECTYIQLRTVNDLENLYFKKFI